MNAKMKGKSREPPVGFNFLIVHISWEAWYSVPSLLPRLSWSNTVMSPESLVRDIKYSNPFRPDLTTNRTDLVCAHYARTDHYGIVPIGIENYVSIMHFKNIYKVYY